MVDELLKAWTPTNFVILAPVYLRGKAYLALRDGDRAAAAFQSGSSPLGVRQPGSALCAHGDNCPNGGQPGQPISLRQGVQRKRLVKFGSLLPRPCSIACPRQGQSCRGPHITVRGQLQGCVRFAACQIP